MSAIVQQWSRRHAHKYVPWFFIGLFLVTTVWIVFVWYQLFQQPLLSEEEVAQVRTQYAGTVFKKEAFDAVVEREKRRKQLFDTAAINSEKDPFFPRDYVPRDKALR